MRKDVEKLMLALKPFVDVWTGVDQSGPTERAFEHAAEVYGEFAEVCVCGHKFSKHKNNGSCGVSVNCDCETENQ